MKNKLIFLLVFFLCNEITAPGVVLAANEGRDAEVLRLLGAENLKKLRKISGDDFGGIKKLLDKDYPDSFLVGSCRGRLRGVAADDYGLAFIQSNLESAIYVAAIRQKDSLFLSKTLTSSAISFNGAGGVIGRGIEVSCESSDELMRLDKDYGRHIQGSTRGSTLVLTTQFDAVCGTPNEGDMEFLCFQYDPRQGAFVGIGGWYNE